jgi:YVTN family beta-propeller protein
MEMRAILVAAVATPVWAGGNLPPVPRAAAAPEEVVVGQVVAFSSAGTLDPDAGPGAVTYLWTFGDGATSTEANPTHAYATPGAWAATLSVHDGADGAVAGVSVFVLEPVAEGTPRASAPLALTPDGAELWVVNPDSDTVSVVDTERTTLSTEIAVGRRPRSVAISPDGESAYVTCQDSDELRVIDVVGRRAGATVPVGRAPYGVVATGDLVLVGEQGSGTVRILGPRGDSELARLDVGAEPRAIAVTPDGRRAFVTHFLTRGDAGLVTVLDLVALDVAGTVSLVEDAGPDTPSSGRGVPNLLGAAAVDPSGRSLWVGGLKSNTGRGEFVSGEPLVPRNRVRGVMMRAGVDAAGEVVERRIDTNDADSVTGIAFSPSGRFGYCVHQGLGALSVYDLSGATRFLPGDGSTVPFESRLDVGDAPQGIVISPDGQRAFVTSLLSREVVVLDLADPRAPVIAATVAVTAEALEESIAQGKRLFYRSRAPVHSEGGYIACASCHADGGMSDGRTWDFSQAGEGLRNTIDLRGRAGMGHGPVHWSANFDEIQDFENDIVHAFGGTGLAADGKPPYPPLSATPNAGRSADLDDLAAYVASLSEVPRSPHRAPDGDLGDAARRGRSLFFDEAVGCASCHAPPSFTDSRLDASREFVLHDVGTLGEGSGGRLGGPLPGLDTPSLLGAWDTPPYLHDGSAATLRHVIRERNPDDRHGATSQLSDAEIDDLVAYLLVIDDLEAHEGPGGCGCRLARRPPRGPWLGVLLLWTLAVARRKK